MILSDVVRQTRLFLIKCCEETDTVDELIGFIEGMVILNPQTMLEGLANIEELLAQNPQDDTILKLITIDTKIKLNPPTFQNAYLWLKWLADQIILELDNNLYPFQPIRARLIRGVHPIQELFPHDLFLYPTDRPKPDNWAEIWTNKHLFYAVFMNEWDGITCPTCILPTIKIETLSAFNLEIQNLYNIPKNVGDNLTIYRCQNCHCGWTQKNDESN